MRKLIENLAVKDQTMETNSRTNRPNNLKLFKLVAKS